MTMDELDGPKSLVAADIEQAPDLLIRVQMSLRSLIEGIPGRTNRAIDLQRTLGLSASLAWQMHRFAHAAEAVAEIRNLPGPYAMQRFLDAALQRGASPESVHEVQEAVGSYESLAAHFAENRTEFRTLLTGLVSNADEQIDLKHRRAVYEALSHLLGFRADTNLGCFMYAPSVDDPLRVDFVTMRTMTGIQRFRRDARVVIASFNRDRGAVPLAGDPEGVGSSLIPDFCSKPLPLLQQCSASGEAINVEMQLRGLGMKSAMTCTVGDRAERRFPRYATDDDLDGDSITRVRTPCKLLIKDVLVYRGLYEADAPTMMAYSDHRGANEPTRQRAADRMPIAESAIFMGRGIESMVADEVPQYPDLLGWAFKRLQWNVDDFDVYRCRVEYPLVPSSIVMRFSLKKQPQRTAAF